MTARRIRKGDYVRLKQGVFLLQKDGEIARVQFVHRHRVHVSPSLNTNSVFSADNLARVPTKEAMRPAMEIARERKRCESLRS